MKPSGLLLLPVLASVSPCKARPTAPFYGDDCSGDLWSWKNPRRFFNCFAEVIFGPPSSGPQIDLPDRVFVSEINAKVKTSLNITNVVVAPNGIGRSAVLANGTFPGPLVKGQKDEGLSIDVTDSLIDHNMNLATSIHWHGINQHKTNWADGVSFVNQCPIVPGSSFNYKFETPNAGTFWYHSHLSNQYCDGLRGPLVVYDPQDPYASAYDVDNEATVITVGDWYNGFSPNHTRQGDPSFTVINGIGRTPLSRNITQTDLAVVKVKYGKRYRMRLINIACDPGYTFSIDQHMMTIIEADAIETQALPNVDAITVYPGQRYSFILYANISETPQNYWIRANPGIPVYKTAFSNFANLAILRYVKAPIQYPTVDPTIQMPPFTHLLNEVELQPLVNPAAPGKPYVDGADVNLIMKIGFNNVAGRFNINNASFKPPNVPVLLQILSGAQSAKDLMPPGSFYLLPPNKTIQISFPLESGVAVQSAPHPIHLHGHDFSVVRSAGSTVYNFKNPVRRDVVSTGDTLQDNVTIRFVTDNPGPWFVHCHIDWHLDAGLAAVIVPDIQGTASANPVTKDWDNLCPLYNAWTPYNPGP